MSTANEELLELEARSSSPETTRALARALGERLQPGDVIGLQGELGAGKTQFVKGLAEALGVDPAQVTSPTFTLINEYPGGRLPLYHVDLYRIARAADLVELGLDDLLRGDGAGAVEWIERFPEVAPPSHLHVAIDVADGEARLLRLTARGRSAVAAVREPPAGWTPAGPR